MKFNLKKNWSYLVFMIPYVVLSLFCIYAPNTISLLNMNKNAVVHFQFHRIITMFFIDRSLISIFFTLYISYVFFQFLGEMLPQVKLVILLFCCMIISGLCFHFMPYTIFNIESAFLLFMLVFFFTIGVALFLYRDEVMARTLISRMWFILFFEAFIIIQGGPLLILVNAIVALSICLVLFFTYYFTEPKKGYML